TALDQTITFDVNGGNIATQPADIIQMTDSTVDLDAVTAPTWFGHKFLGWKDAADTSCSGTITMPAGGLTLIADWQDLIADGTWQIDASDITISYSDLVAMIQSETLDAEILARSGAKAWDSATLAELSPLYVKDLTVVKANPAVGSYVLNVFHDEAIATTFGTKNATTQLNTNITLTVTEDPAQPQLPVTGQNYLEFIGLGFIAVLISSLLIFLKKKSDK
ncbi:InlB B-repeat-containing protein, partial [Culicoidibacter larvae]